LSSGERGRRRFPFASTGDELWCGESTDNRKDVYSPAGTAEIGNLNKSNVPAGTYMIGNPEVFNCTVGNGPCMYEMQIVVQVNNGAVANNQFAFCFFIDGVASDDCYDRTEYQQRSDLIHAMNIPRGNHTVHAAIFSTHGLLVLNRIDIDFRLYPRH
jgi:hypothetical protein